jgi:predicted transcriptional regulator of viral defense system
MTYRDLLYDRALDQYGYVTTDDARELGVPTIELRKLAMRHAMFNNIARGLYRFDRVPSVDFPDVMEAVLMVGRDAVAARETVLYLHDLADVLPPTNQIATRHRVRRALPHTVEVFHELVADEDRTFFDGIPTTTVRRALLDCRDTVPTDRLLEAVDDAVQRGLILEADVPALVDALVGGP